VRHLRCFEAFGRPSTCAHASLSVAVRDETPPDLTHISS
jgi:hypothetical protein